jgi:lysophospholipase L1-like esterase
MGEGVAEQDRWPSHLVRLLDREGLHISDLQLVAQTAWTADELSDAIDQARPTGPFDLVTLMVGVNDQYRSRPVDAFSPEYERLLKRAIGFAGRKERRVIAISIPDWGATPFAKGRDRSLIGREIDAYNTRSRELAELARVPWVDVTPSSRATLTEPALVTADGLHPSGAMYERWAQLIAPAAIAALRRVVTPLRIPSEAPPEAR